MKKLLAAIFVAALAIPACGSDGPSSGVDGNKKASELTAMELSTVCSFYIAQVGGSGETVCSTSSTSEVSTIIPTQAECEMEGNLPGACTVRTLEACAVSTNGMACQITETPECGSYILCAFSSL